jgi:hypothetical protein
MALVSLGVGVLLCGPALASVIATDGFEDYAAGDPLENGAGVGLNGGTGWTGAWNVNNSYRVELNIIDGGLFYSGGIVKVNGGDLALELDAANASIVEIAGRPFPAQTDTIYLSFLYSNMVDVGPGSGDDFLQLGFDSSYANPRVSAMDRNTTFQARLTTSSGNSFDSHMTSVAGETYFLVLRADKVGGSANYNQVALYVNPTSYEEALNSPAVTGGPLNSGLGTATWAMIRRAFQESGDTYVIDEFQISTTFADALHAPEPASLLLLLAGGALLRRRRR